MVRNKIKTPKEELIEKTINLTLSGLQAKQMWEKSRQAANDNIFTKINITIASAVVQAKEMIDGLLGDKKDKIHDFLADLFL